MIQWQQIKEKWGHLCLYACGTKEILGVLSKYEELSKKALRLLWKIDQI